MVVCRKGLEGAWWATPEPKVIGSSPIGRTKSTKNLQRPPRRPARQWFAVGTPVSRRPPRGSELAELLHSALALGPEAQPLRRIGVHDADPREPALDERAHACRRHPAFLTTPLESTSPAPNDVEHEGVERSGVQGNAVVVDVPLDHRAQPLPHLGDGVMPAGVSVRLSPR